MIVLSTRNEELTAQNLSTQSNSDAEEQSTMRFKTVSKPQEVFVRNDVILKVMSVVGFVSLSPRRKKRVLIPITTKRSTDIDGETAANGSRRNQVRLIGLANPPRILPGNCARSLLPVVPNHCQPPLGTNISHRVPATSPEGSALVKSVTISTTGLNPRHLPPGATSHEVPA